MKKRILILIISSLSITTIHAQQKSEQGTLKINKWSITTNLGWSVGGPCKQVKQTMITYDFDDHQGSGWFSRDDSGTDHPYTEHYKPSWMTSVKYYLNSSLSVGIFGGKTNLGRICGYKSGSSIDIDFSAYNIAPVFSYNVYDIIRIGIGPSVYFTKSWESTYHYEGIDVEYKHTKIGFIVDVGLRIPEKTLFYFELNGQFRYAGKEEIGPFNEDSYPNALPKMEITYNHGFISAGFGVRF